MVVVVALVTSHYHPRHPTLVVEEGRKEAEAALVRSMGAACHNQQAAAAEGRTLHHLHLRLLLQAV